MRRVLLAALLLTALAGAGALLTCVPLEKIEPAPACLAVINCYFAEDDPNPDAGSKDHQLYRVGTFSGLGGDKRTDPDLFRKTYGKDGTCWISNDKEVAHSCEDRCRGLLWQDCNQPFVPNKDDPTLPFCHDRNDAGVLVACSFPEECSDPGVRGKDVDGGPRQDASPSVCPTPDAKCSAPANEVIDGGSTFGCCELPKFADGGPGSSGCPYLYIDPIDHRNPAGEPSGLLLDAGTQ